MSTNTEELTTTTTTTNNNNTNTNNTTLPNNNNNTNSNSNTDTTHDLKRPLPSTNNKDKKKSKRRKLVKRGSSPSHFLAEPEVEATFGPAYSHELPGKQNLDSLFRSSLGLYLKPKEVHSNGASVWVNNDYDVTEYNSFDMLRSPLRRPQVLDKWTPKEIALFESCICEFGKDFHCIAQHIRTKTTNECVEFYYRVWKNSKHYFVWKNAQKGAIINNNLNNSNSNKEKWNILDQYNNNNNIQGNGLNKKFSLLPSIQSLPDIPKNSPLFNKFNNTYLNQYKAIASNLQPKDVAPNIAGSNNLYASSNPFFTSAARSSIPEDNLNKLNNNNNTNLSILKNFQIYSHVDGKTIPIPEQLRINSENVNNPTQFVQNILHNTVNAANNWPDKANGLNFNYGKIGRVSILKQFDEHLKVDNATYLQELRKMLLENNPSTNSTPIINSSHNNNILPSPLFTSLNNNSPQIDTNNNNNITTSSVSSIDSSQQQKSRMTMNMKKTNSGNNSTNGSPDLSSKDNSMRTRRPAHAIDRSYRCEADGCGKAYGSHQALYIHTKNKHFKRLRQMHVNNKSYVINGFDMHDLSDHELNNDEESKNSTDIKVE